MNKIYDFEFQDTNKIIKDNKIEFGTRDLMCWNFSKNECGIIYGSGVDWTNKIIYKSKIGFLNTSPLKPRHIGRNRNDDEVLVDMLNALQNPNSSLFTQNIIVFEIKE